MAEGGLASVNHLHIWYAAKAARPAATKKAKAAQVWSQFVCIQGKCPRANPPKLRLQHPIPIPIPILLNNHLQSPTVGWHFEINPKCRCST